MSTLRPFKALRPKKEFAERIASRPYDVVSTEEAKVEAKGNPYSFMHICRSEIDLPDDTDHYSPVVYEKARQNLLNMVKEGILFEENKPTLYIYSQTMNGRTQFGIVGCTSVDEYYNNTIKKHELTRRDKEDDRTRHIHTTNANAEPVFLTYRDHAGVNSIVSGWVSKNRPEYSFTSNDGIKHEVWVIDNQSSVDLLVKYFKEIPELYIADGHHRTASAARVGKEKKLADKAGKGNEEYNFFMSVCFPASHLMIMDYNRLVKDFNGLTKEGFIEKLSQKFEISETGQKKPSANNTVCMYLKGGHWYTLKAKAGSFDAKDPINSLDVAILQNNVLDPLLGIKDPRTDKRIDFVGGIRGTSELEKRVESGEFAVAFSMYPPTIAQLMSVADAGKIMPPKSTWFEPKLRSGLLIHQL